MLSVTCHWRAKHVTLPDVWSFNENIGQIEGRSWKALIQSELQGSDKPGPSLGVITALTLLDTREFCYLQPNALATSVCAWDIYYLIQRTHNKFSVWPIYNGVHIEQGQQQYSFLCVSFGSQRKVRDMRLGSTVPNFWAETTMGPIKFHEWLGQS